MNYRPLVPAGVGFENIAIRTKNINWKRWPIVAQCVNETLPMNKTVIEIGGWGRKDPDPWVRPPGNLDTTGIIDFWGDRISIVTYSIYVDQGIFGSPELQNISSSIKDCVERYGNTSKINVVPYTEYKYGYDELPDLYEHYEYFGRDPPELSSESECEYSYGGVCFGITALFTIVFMMARIKFPRKISTKIREKVKPGLFGIALN